MRKRAPDKTLACFQVLSNGSAVTASPCSHADLFWALRGAGGSSLAVLTSATYRLHPFPPGGVAGLALTVGFRTAGAAALLLSPFMEVRRALSGDCQSRQKPCLDSPWLGVFAPADLQLMVPLAFPTPGAVGVGGYFFVSSSSFSVSATGSRIAAAACSIAPISRSSRPRTAVGHGVQLEPSCCGGGHGTRARLHRCKSCELFAAAVYVLHGTFVQGLGASSFRDLHCLSCCFTASPVHSTISSTRGTLREALTRWARALFRSTRRRILQLALLLWVRWQTSLSTLQSSGTVR